MAPGQFVEFEFKDGKYEVHLSTIPRVNDRVTLHSKGKIHTGIVHSVEHIIKDKWSGDIISIIVRIV